jgi:hypothetical protein
MDHQKLEQLEIQQTTFGDAISYIFFEYGSDNRALGGIILFHRLRTDVGGEWFFILTGQNLLLTVTFRLWL